MTPQEPPPIWAIMPILAQRDYTIAAIADLLAQTVPIRILLVNQGVEPAFRAELEQIAETYPERVFLWSHHPKLPSLAATWNRALDFAWETGAEVALVVNNDVRLAPCTVQVLDQERRRADALFVTAVGVTAEQYASADFSHALTAPFADHGGPDFSCFLISRSCHRDYRFDEGFVPAYGEDCCYHRELMLADEGHLIYSINLPYLHYASGTLKAVPDARRREIERQIALGSRTHYQRCWGGPVNAERYTVKGDPTSARDGVTNPELQRIVQTGRSVRGILSDLSEVR